MIIFKLEDDKTLLMTHGVLLNQYEHRSDDLVFYIPQTIDGASTLDYSVSLRYTLLEGGGESFFLSKKDDLYNGYLQYFCPITTSMVADAGEIQLCLSFVDGNDNAVMRSSVATLQVLPSIGSGEAIETDQMDQLDWLTIQINKINAEGVGGADNLIYDDDTRKLQLVADGAPIGDAVIVPSDGYTGGETSVADQMETRVKVLEAINHDAYVAADETNLQAAKDYANTKVTEGLTWGEF